MQMGHRNGIESELSTLSLIKRFALMWHLSESLWTTNSNERQADSCDELSEWCKDKRDSTALGRGSDAVWRNKWMDKT